MGAVGERAGAGRTCAKQSAGLSVNAVETLVDHRVLHCVCFLLQAYWRSCAMMLGCVIERAFKDDYVVSLVRAQEVPGNVHVTTYTFKICECCGICV